MRILVSGHNGFIGGHLVKNIYLHYPQHKVITLEKKDFKSKTFNHKIDNSDIIFHLAGVNKADTEKAVYDKNQKINVRLLNQLKKIDFSGILFFSSSVQEEKSTLYGKAKKEARIQFEELSKKQGFNFYCLKIPNVFGPFCKPNYNSFIATFSHQLINNNSPTIVKDNQIELIYIDDLIKSILKIIEGESPKINRSRIYSLKVSEVLEKLTLYKKLYIDGDEFCEIENHFDLSLYNTFRSYMNPKSIYPKKHFLHKDDRGFFTEIARANSKSQSSFSVTKPGFTRGNHFHTRKVERFSVIKGKATIKLRKYLCKEVFSFELDGSTPSFIDMPIWYTHNITNTGNDELITFFWINEPFNNNDPDTYFEIV